MKELKRILKLLFLTVSIFAISGCMNYDVDMQVNKDKSVDFKLDFNMNVTQMESGMGDLMDGMTGDTDEAVDFEKTIQVGESIDVPYEINGHGGSGDVIEFTDDNTKIKGVKDGIASGWFYLTNDDTKTYKIIVGSGESLEETSNEDELSTDESYIDEEQTKEFKDKGYKVEPYQKTNEKGEKISGVVLSKKFNKIDDIVTDKDENCDLGGIFSDTGEFDDSTLFKKSFIIYKSNIVFDFSEESSDEESSDEESLGAFGSLTDSFSKDAVKVKYVVKLPYKSISNNAKSVSKDGKTLTWEIDPSSKNEIEYSFMFIDMNIIIFGGIGLVALIIIIIVIVVIKKKKNSKAESTTPVYNSEEVTNNTSAPGAEPISGTVPVAEPAPTVEATPVAEPVPTVEVAPAVEPAPTVEVAPAVEPAPTVEVAPAVEPAPTVEVAPAVEPAPTVEVAPAVEPAPTVEAAPVVEPTPTVEAAPVVEPTPAATPTDNNTPVA